MEKQKRAFRTGIIFLISAVLITITVALADFKIPNYTAKEIKILLSLLDLALVTTAFNLIIRRKRRFILEAVVFCWISFLAAFFLAELACRFYLFGPDCLSLTKMNSVYSSQGDCQPDIYQRAELKELLVEFKPNVDTIFHLKHFQTNSAGLRDREYPLEKPDNTFRVAVVGDSLTMGWGVEHEKTYAKLLEKWTNQKWPGKYEFIIFGHPGYALEQYMVVIENKVLPYHPDMIIVGFCYNDDEIITPEQMEQRGPLPPPNNPFCRLFMLDLIKTSRLYQSFVNPEAGSITPEEKQIRRAYGQKWFSRFKQFSQQHNIPIAVADLYMPGAREIFAKEFSAQYNLDYIPTKDYFGPEGFKHYAIYPIDGHPNHHAHEKYAHAIFDYLQTKLNKSTPQQ